MKRVYSSSNHSPWALFNRLPAWRKAGFLTTALAVGLTGLLFAQEQKGDVPSPPTPVTDLAVPNPVPEVLGAEPGEVLTRGPIHEAFAKPAVENTAEPPIVPKAPPALIEELPPDERPVGENVLWIPGYFAWDEDRLDFIWISGVYRDAPPNHTWIAGYWRSAPGGSQWVPGFWTTVEQQTANKIETEVEFYPEPPVTLEQGPSIPQPSENHFWIPGNWRYANNKYAWQAGYWSAGQAGWIWVPAHYNWTPMGYVYTQGYWDYSLAQRGLVFAPVYFDAAYYANPVVYRPQVILRSNFLTVHLWSRPRFAHYYFGDYYGNNYATVGYRPWFTPLVANRNYYDPLFTYYSWQGRRVDPRWNNHIQQRHEYVMNHADARPPRTYRDQYRMSQQPQFQQYVNNVNIVNTTNTVFDINNTTVNNNQRRPRSEAFGTADDVASLQIQNVAMTANLAQVATQQKELPQAALQLQKVDPETRTRFANQGKQFREIAAQRQQMAGARPAGVTTETVAPSTSGNPTTKTVTGDPRTKVGGGKVRLPVVQPVAAVAATGGVAVPGGAGVGADAIVPGTNGNVAGQGSKKGGFPGVNKAAGTPAGKGNAADGTDIPTDRNPNKLGKNVPPGLPAPGIGGGVVGGSIDPGVAPLDIISGGNTVNPTTNNPGTNGTTTNPAEVTTPGAPTNNPNTTANTVPGQRTPTNGAFGQDRGALVPPGELAPGQQNPEVFNPRVADPNAKAGSKNAPAFNPRVADPTKSTNPDTTTTTPGNTTPGTNNNPKTTANTVPGQRTPTNGAFGQDRGALVPPGQLAPGQQNPEVFNPRVADPNAAPGSKNAPAFNPRVADPNSPAKSGANPASSGNNTKSGTTPGAAGANNTKATPPANATPNTAPRGRNPASGPNTINGRPVGGDAGNTNPVLGKGPSAGPKINPNPNPPGNTVNPPNKGKGMQNPAPDKGNPNVGNPQDRKSVV